MSRTLITFVLDRSGSMSSIKAATIEAFNTYLKGLQDDLTTNGGDPIDFTLIEFETGHIDRVHFEKPIGEVPLMTHESYRPGGGTPLIDAAMTTILALEKAIEAKADKPKVIVCIQTDGGENDSKEYPQPAGWETLKAKIAAKIADGWQFNFMGAGIDAYDQGAKMGIDKSSTISYDSTDLYATTMAFAASASNASEYRRGASLNTAYSFAQKLGAGDAYDPDVNAVPKAPAGQRTKLHQGGSTIAQGFIKPIPASALNLGGGETVKPKEKKGLDLTSE